MNKITLEFTGADYENGLVAAKATDLWLALYDISQKLKSTIKWDETEEKETPAEWADNFHDVFWEILDQYNITLEELS